MKLFILYVESSSAGQSLEWALPFPEPLGGTCWGQHFHPQKLGHAGSILATSQEDGDMAAAGLGERTWLSVCPCINSGWMFLSWVGPLKVFCSICLPFGLVEEHLEKDGEVNVLGGAESSLGWAWNLTLKQVFLWFWFKPRHSVDFQEGERHSSLHKALYLIME